MAEYSAEYLKTQSMKMFDCFFYIYNIYKCTAYYLSYMTNLLKFIIHASRPSQSPRNASIQTCKY